MLFHETFFGGVTQYSVTECPPHLICTVPMVIGGSICFMDEGTNLYLPKLRSSFKMTYENTRLPIYFLKYPARPKMSMIQISALSNFPCVQVLVQTRVEKFRSNLGARSNPARSNPGRQTRVEKPGSRNFARSNPGRENPGRSAQKPYIIMRRNVLKCAESL